jgi:hypothetical protein
MAEFHLYFHKDFDGICGTALFSAFLQIATIFKLTDHENFVYHPVDYDIKDKWLELKLLQENAALDFPYHPEAGWWFDHHDSAFLKSNLKRKYKHTQSQFWDTSFHSCPSLIKYHFQKSWSLFANIEALDQLIKKNSQWIEWSDIIDGARYHSPNEPVELKHPCLEINATLSIDSSLGYLVYLIEHIKTSTPGEVARLDPVKTKLQVYQERQERVMAKFKVLLEVYRQEIAYFNLTGTGIPFNRYLAYYFYPDLSYTIGIYEKKRQAFVISVGKNPWKQFPAKNIGKTCMRYGGGGRKEVGAVMVNDYNSAVEISKKIRSYLWQGLQENKEE